MITGHDFYAIMTAMVPLYVAMFLAYGSVRWWKIFTPDQCSGINRFVAIFAVPLLSFHFISMNNPYKMNLRFIAADTLQKLIMLVVLGVSTRFINLLTFEWTITIFSLSTLPNSLVIGIPLLSGMYGESSATLMVQIVVMQSIVWYTLLLFLFEFRGAKVLIMERFPQSGGEIAEIEVDPDVVSLDAQDVIETTSERRRDGKLLVTVRKSSASRRSFGVGSLSNAEIYSVSSSAVQTPRASFFNQSDINSFVGFPGGRLSNFGPADDVYTIHSSSWGPGHGHGHGQGHVTSPRNSNFEVDPQTTSKPWLKQNISQHKPSHDIHVFDRSSSAPANSKAGRPRSDFSLPTTHLARVASELSQKGKPDVESAPDHGPATVLVSNEGAGSQMPSASVMGRLILLMVWRKLIRNPNTYGSITGLIWALVSYRWDVTMPKIVEDSISLISKTGLGMAMFSLGLFMALQPKLIACGKSKAIIGMVAKFLIGPGVTAVSALIVGLHGTLLRVTIVQATLSAGIVPFVFAKEYDVHPTILSTAVIFGMLITVPITLCYYILLEL